MTTGRRYRQAARYAALLIIPAMLAVACANGDLPDLPFQLERSLPDMGSLSDADRPAGNDDSGGGTSLQASWNEAMVARYAELDGQLMGLLSRHMDVPGVSYSDFSAVVRGSCDLLDREVDVGKPLPGLERVHAKSHTPEGQMAVWLYVRNGAQWDGYCDFHRTKPEPTPWPTPTALPPAPLTVCPGWDGFDDFPCGMGGTRPGNQIRVKILQEGQAGRLEITYPERPPDVSDGMLCDHTSASTGFHLRASKEPVFKRFVTCAEGLVEFRWEPDDGEAYLYQFRVVDPAGGRPGQ